MQKFINILLLFIATVATAPSADAAGAVKFNSFDITQNKMVDGHRCLHADLDIWIMNLANSKAKVTVQIEDSRGNLLSTTEGYARVTKSLNLSNNDFAMFSNLKFNISNQYFLTSSRVGKTLVAKFFLTVDGETVFQGQKEFTARRAKSQTETVTPRQSKTTPSKPRQSPAPKSGNGSSGNSNGKSNYKYWEEPCRLCSGSGLCKQCWGNKEVFSQAAQMMWPCAACYGSGKCRMCEGRKYNIYETWTLNGINYMRTNNGQAQVVGRSENDLRRCGSCTGSGRCTVCTGSGYVVGYTAGSSRKCDACNGTGRCRSCDGKGYK